MSEPAHRYSLPSRVLRRFPLGTELLWKAVTLTPYPLSRALLAVGRSRHLFPENRLPSWKAVFDHVRREHVPGDYVEFGVFRGQSFIMAFHLGRDLDMHFYAFDSFEGLPRDEDIWKRGEFRCDERYFRRSLRKAGVDLQRVTTVPGYYETITQAAVPQLARAAVVHIDCDLYTSTVEAFRIVGGMIGPGTVLIFDDWFSFANVENPHEFGEQRAFYEWSEASRFMPFIERAPWHKSFVCTR